MLLNSWKEIAGYLKCGVRTAQRWQRDLHMPVMRVRGGQRGPVMADSEELDAWIRRRSSEVSSDRYTTAQETLAGKSTELNTDRYISALEALARKSTESGLRFLLIELSAGRQFAKLAQETTNALVTARRKKGARRAYDTIQRHLAFTKALPKAELSKFNAELREFESELQKLGE